MERYTQFFTEKVQASQVSKDLQKAGWSKFAIKRINFQNVEQGDYKISTVNKFGVYAVLIYPIYLNNVKQMMSDLNKYNPVYQQGYIMIK